MRCVFLTEGDFGSHIHIPPFMGHDVVAIAPQSLYDFESTPIEFWNGSVFRFGGQTRPAVAEDVFSSDASIECFSKEIDLGT